MKKAKMLIIVILVSFFLNFGWEYLQSPFYDCFKNSLADNYWHYLLAIVGDSFYTVVIYLAIAAYDRNLRWLEKDWNSRNMILSAIMGMILAIFIEYKGVYVLGKWSYSPLMPLVFGIGIIPVVQMIILPALSFKISRSLIKGAVC